MLAVALGTVHIDEALRLVRALGAHRYIAGRLHLVHAFAFDAVPDDAAGRLAAARAWAQSVLADGRFDPASRDEALWRRSSDDELLAVLESYWVPGARAQAARDALLGALARHQLPLAGGTPFDESGELEMHPLLVDAGWELLSLGELDPAARHKGVVSAFGGALGFESACFEEETAVPSPAHLYELPALGASELVHGAGATGDLTTPLVAWVEGNEVYLDYVLRGVRRAAKVAEPEA